MKTTLLLCPVLALMLCLRQSVLATPVNGYHEGNSIQRQTDYFLPETKRSKPSLSIVNPLDVLRQRLLLEIARRQMRENTKQVEINRAILKNVGKRHNHAYDYDIISDYEKDDMLPQYADDIPANVAQLLHNLQTNREDKM